MTEVYRLSEHIYRMRHWNGTRQRDSLAGKYGLINLTPDGEPTLLRADTEDTVTLERGYTLSFRLASDAEGSFSIRLPLFPDDKLFGLGDAD